MNKKLLTVLIAALCVSAHAEEYVVDTRGMHAFVQFRVKHLGFSWLYGRFDRFSGEFSFDPDKPEASRIGMTIDTTSVDTNHADRDKHIRGGDFLDVEKYPTATFETTSVAVTGENTADVTGNLTLHGTTNPVTIKATYIGGGKDPWGGNRQGFEGTATIEPNAYGIEMVERLGAASGTVDLIVSVEGVQKR